MVTAPCVACGRFKFPRDDVTCFWCRDPAERRVLLEAAEQRPRLEDDKWEMERRRLHARRRPIRRR